MQGLTTRRGAAALAALVTVGACSAPAERVPPGWTPASAHVAASAPPHVTIDGAPRSPLLQAWDGDGVPAVVPTTIPWDDAASVDPDATTLTVGLAGSAPPERAVLQTFAAVDASGVPGDATAETVCTRGPGTDCDLRHDADEGTVTLELPEPLGDARYATLQLTWLDLRDDGTIAELWATWGVVTDGAR